MVKKFFRVLWTGVDGFRKIVHLVLMVLVFVAMLAALGSGGTPVKIEPDSVLRLNPSGVLVHELQAGELDLELQKMSGDPAPETLVRDVVRALEKAAEDERIVAVLLDTQDLAGGGFTKLQDITAAIREFRTSGKPVISYARGYSQSDYMLAAQADEVYVHDLSGVDIRGFGRWRIYHAEALKKLDIDAHVFRIGEYKSFVEPYFRNSMSDEDREMAEQWLGALWGAYQSEVTEARGLPADALDEYAAGFTQAVEEAGGHLAQVNLEAGLVDALYNDDTFSKHMEERFGSSEDEEYNSVSLTDYLAATDRERSRKTDHDDKVAVVSVVGSIVDGSAPPGTAGGDSIAKLVRNAGEDDSVKALVLQVDSGGGSAFASEVISAAVSTVSEAGKPVVVSMSSVAASGGYYVGAEADEMWAYPSTITGSIGVGAVLFTAPRLFERLGLAEDGLGTTPLADNFLLGRDMGEDTRKQMDAQVRYVYERFVDHVSKGRALTFDEVDAVGRGRVWIGTDAAGVNLVDQLGALDDAIKSAASLADLQEEEYGVKRMRRKRPFFTGFNEFLQVRLARLKYRLGFHSEPDRFMDAVQHARRTINSELDRLALLNDPRGYYYLCGECTVN